MPCPFFFPLRALGNQGAARVPLGAIFAGLCRASQDGTVEPPEPRQRELCNRGYARGACPCFPDDAASDAVRFSVASDENGCIRLLYVFERDHAPVEHGRLEYGSELHGAEGRDVLAAQVRAFLESYRRNRPARPGYSTRVVTPGESAPPTRTTRL